MSSDEIEIKDCSDPGAIELGTDFPRITSFISYNEFFKVFLLTNQPCLFNDFITSKWKSQLLWVRDGKPHWDHLKELYGNAEVPVADCREREYDAQKKSTFKMEEYIVYIKNYIQEGYPQTKHSLYLKDWHFTRDFPDAEIYQVPKYFASDWLNEYYATRAEINDDYRFVYIGPKGTWTPLHADVFTSFSWSVNVVGRKRWLLFPPGQEIHLKDRFGTLVYDATSSNLYDTSLYPSYCHLQKKYDIIQEPGEAIFVPSGWHHQVWNLEDCISINHNWVNGCNIRQMWHSLKNSLTAVKKEVSDCCDMEDWDSHCQLLLRATYGLDCKEFFDMLACVAKPRIAQLEGKEPMLLYGGWQLGYEHASWDLHQVLAVLTLLCNDTDFQCLPCVKDGDLDKLVQQIKDVLTHSKLDLIK